MGVEDAVVKWFSSYITDKHQFVNVNGYSSTPLDIISGVPQGSILIPLLFKLYVNDMVYFTTCDLFVYADN